MYYLFVKSKGGKLAKYKTLKVGDRVELVYMEDTLTNLKPGDQGTIFKIDDAEELIWINWDNGEQLALIEGHDQYRIVKN
jgi:hypothetical protein